MPRPDAIYVPDLGAKLQKLYSSKRNPEIASHDALAKKLGLSGRGNTGNFVRDDKIPEKHIESLCLHFRIDRKKFEQLTAQQFESYLVRSRSPWQQLMELAESSGSPQGTNVELIPEGEDPMTQFAEDTFRGIGGIDKGDAPSGPILHLGQKFRLALTAYPGWSFLILVDTPLGSDYVWPTSVHRDNAFNTNTLEIFIPPKDLPAAYAEPPTGAHSLLIVFTEKGWTEELYSDLWAKDKLGAAIAHIFVTLTSPDAGKWLVHRIDFQIR